MTKNYLGLDFGVNSISFTAIQIDNQTNSVNILDQVVIILNGIETEDFSNGKMISPAKIRNQFKRARTTRKRKNKNKKKVSELLKTLFGFNPAIHKYDNLNDLKIKALKDKIELSELSAILFNYSKWRGYNELDENSLGLDSKNLGAYKKAIAGIKAECEEKGIYISEYYAQHPEINLHKNNLNTQPVVPQELYKDELIKIWETQSQYYSELTKDKLDRIINQIYFRRGLQSVQDMKNDCLYFPNNKVTPLANPLFQRFRVWSIINYLKCKSHNLPISDKAKNELYKLCSEKETVTKDDIINVLYDDWNLGDNIKDYLINYNSIKGLTTEIRIKKELSRTLSDDELTLCWNDVYSSSNLTKWGFNNKPVLEIGNSSYSQKAIKQLLSYMNGSKGVYLTEEEAFIETGFRDILNLLNKKSVKKLLPFKQEDLRNPVVTKVLNNGINIINTLLEKYEFDGYRIELVRELKNNNKQKENISKNNTINSKINKEIESLVKLLNSKYESKKFLLKAKLWLEQAGINISNLKEVKDAISDYKNLKSICPYSKKTIPFKDCLNGAIVDIDHIIPQKSRIDDSFNNYVLSYKEFNIKKGGRTAFEYFYDENIDLPNLKNYSEYKRNQFKYADKSYMNLKVNSYTSIDIDNLDFSNSNLNDTSYISKKLSEELRKISNDVIITNGSMTSIIKNLTLDDDNTNIGSALSEKYFPLWHNTTNKNLKGHTRAKKTKRDDNRHHALDSFIISLIDRNIVKLFSSINKNNRNVKKLLREYILEKFFSGESPKNWIEENLVKSLKSIIVNQKKTPKKIYKRKDKFGKDQVLVRGNLFKQTVYGSCTINGETFNTNRMKITDFTKLKHFGDIIDITLRDSIIDAIKVAFPNIKDSDIYGKSKQDESSEAKEKNSGTIKITYKDNIIKMKYENIEKEIIFKIPAKRIKIRVNINKPILRKGDRDNSSENIPVFMGNTNIWNEYTKNEKGKYITNTVTLLGKSEDTIDNIKSEDTLKIEPFDYMVLGYNKEEVDEMINSGDKKFIEEDKLFFITQVSEDGIYLRPHYITTGGVVKYDLNGKENDKPAQAYYMKKNLDSLINDFEKLCLVKVKMNDIINVIPIE